MTPPDFASKVAIVTGSSSGIGKAVALQLAECGAAVIGVADRNVAGGQATARQIADSGGRSAFIRADEVARKPKNQDEADMKIAIKEAL